MLDNLLRSVQLTTMGIQVRIPLPVGGIAPNVDGVVEVFYRKKKNDVKIIVRYMKSEPSYVAGSLLELGRTFSCHS